MGYKNIIVYAEGIPGWSNAGYPLNKEKALPRVEISQLTPAQLNEKIGEAHLLDVRLEEDYKDSFIKGSQNISINLLSRRFQEVPKGKPIIVVDTLGNPHWIAAGWFLKSKGYTDVMMLKGGMEVWKKEGFPIEK